MNSVGIGAIFKNFPQLGTPASCSSVAEFHFLCVRGQRVWDTLTYLPHPSPVVLLFTQGFSFLVALRPCPCTQTRIPGKLNFDEQSLKSLTYFLLSPLVCHPQVLGAVHFTHPSLHLALFSTCYPSCGLSSGTSARPSIHSRGQPTLAMDFPHLLGDQVQLPAVTHQTA